MDSGWDVINSHWSIVAFIIMIVIYYSITFNFEYFEYRDVPYVQPIAIFGNVFKVFARQESLTELIQRLYNGFPDTRFFGFFEYLTPIYVICEPEYIKQIEVKYFDHFEPFPLKKPALLKHSLSTSVHRSLLGSIFEDDKMLFMFNLINDCAHQSLKYLKTQFQNDTIELDIKDFSSHYACNVIATSVFGVDITADDFVDNKFYHMSNHLLECSRSFALGSLFLKLMTLLKVCAAEPNTVQTLEDIVLMRISERSLKAELSDRPDIINILLKARNKNADIVENSEALPEALVQDMSDDDIAAICTSFFLAGHKLATHLITYMTLELAQNPEIQSLLLEEVDETKTRLAGTPITFGIVQNMRYMKMVISEVLRKWPPTAFVDRKCIESYVMENSDGNLVEIDRGDRLRIPVSALQHNPVFYSNPDEFNPQRFSDENRARIIPFTYIPFGVGPRECVDYRLVLSETKALFFHILSSFTIEKSLKSHDPLQRRSQMMQLMQKEVLRVQLKVRKYSKADRLRI